MMRSAGIANRAASPRAARVASRLLYGPPNTIRGPSTRNKGIDLGIMPSRLSDQGGRSSQHDLVAEFRLAIALVSESIARPDSRATTRQVHGSAGTPGSKPRAGVRSMLVDKRTSGSPRS